MSTGRGGSGVWRTEWGQGPVARRVVDQARMALGYELIRELHGDVEAAVVVRVWDLEDVIAEAIKEQVK